MLQLTGLSITSQTCVSVKLWVQSQSSSSRVSDLQRAEEADSGDSQAEDGLSSLGSEPRAAWQGCWIFVGLGGVEATPGLDIEVGHIFTYVQDLPCY